jgi:hypothetical protein
MNGAAVRHLVSDFLEECGKEQDHSVLVGEERACSWRDWHGIAVHRQAHGVMSGGLVELVVADAIDNAESSLASRYASDTEFRIRGRAIGG